MDISGIERALGAVGTTFRLTRLYPPTHPAVQEAMRQITGALPALAALGTVEWKIGATGLHWHGQHLLPRNQQIAELAGLLYARGLRAIQFNPGITADHVLALFGVATGTLQPDDGALGRIALTLGRRSQRLSRTATPVRGVPAVDPPTPAAVEAGAPAAPVQPALSRAPPSESVAGRRSTAAFRLDALPPDVAAKRAIAGLRAAAPEERRAAVEQLIELAPAIIGLRDLAALAEAIAGLEHLISAGPDAALLEAIDRAAAALTEKGLVQRMVTRLGEPRVPTAEREALIAAVGALAAVSMPIVLETFLATPVGLRAPYRAAVRHAADRAVEPLQGRLADRNPEIVAVAAEFIGLTGSPQAVPLLLPLLRHESEFVREAGLVGLTEAGGREISRPAMPALKDQSVLVRAAAARAIGVGGEAGSTTVLVRRLDQEEDEGVQAEILRAIGRLGSREALEVLARYAEPGGMLKRRSPSVRAAAIEGLARVTGSEARALLELYSKDKEPTVRKAAEAALR